MAEEKVAPEAPTAPVPPVEKPEEPKTQPEPTPPPVQSGPSVEEVMARVSKLEGDLAQTRHEANYFRTLVEQNRGVPQPTAPGVPDEPPVTDEEFIVNPKAAYMKLRKWEQDKDRATREREEQTRYVENARMNFNVGRNAALAKNPNVFKGIEQDVDVAMFEALKAKAIAPDVAAKPEFWEATAREVRWNKGERDFGKYYSPAPTPTQPVHQEIPTPHEPPKAAIALTAEEKAMAERFGLKEEQLIATKKAQLGVEG